MERDMIADLLPISELYRLAASIMRRRAPYILHQSQDDTVQDLILSALLAIQGKEFGSKSHLVCYVYQAMDFKALSLVNRQFTAKKNNGINDRSLDHELTRGRDDPITLMEMLSDGKDWETDMIKAIDDEALMDRLYMIRDDKLRDILQRRINGETLRQIAETYGITYQAVSSYINNGFRRFPWLEQWLKCGIMEVKQNDE